VSSEITFVSRRKLTIRSRARRPANAQCRDRRLAMEN
jgi:hypothetical protein